MSNHDFSIQHIGLNGMIRFKSTFTQNAPPNVDYEVHPHYQEFELYRFLEGDLVFAVDGRHIKVEEGMVILIANGVLHRPIIKNRCRYRRDRILFRKEIFIRFNTMTFELYNKLKNRRVLVLNKELVEKSGINGLIDEVGTRLAQNTSYDGFCALISLLALLIQAEAHSRQIENILPAADSERVSEMIRYIDEHLMEDLSYRTLSDVFCLSEKSLYKFFKNEIGFAPGSYINERRIIMAQSILSAGGSAKAAAYAAGFKDYSVFYRCFLKKVGMTPAEYRKSEGY